MHARHHIKEVRFATFLLCALSVAWTSEAEAQYGGGGYGGYSQGGYGNQGNYGNQGHHSSNYRPDYRHGHGGHDKWDRGDYRRFPSSNFNYGYYQRPYPYHLDYYRMKYNGSYEPYFGNLYGPPLIQQNIVSPFGSPSVVVPQSFGSPFFPSPIRSHAGAFFW